ncbi:MAG: MOSC domain-containing protein [Stackebrandtia sp.]
MVEIAELVTYPVKSCAGVSTRDATVTPAGLAHDRSFLVVDENGLFRCQRRNPRMALIRPEIDPRGERLTLHAPDVEAVSIDVDVTAARRDVEMFGKPYRGVDQGETVAEWLSEALDAKCRLVRVPPEHDRVSDGLTPGTAGYADSSAVLMASEASLEQLNRRLVARGDDRLPMNRFRPNIVVSGWDEPHVEDLARRVVVGGAELGYAKLAIRCVVTTVDQDRGEKAGPEPLRTLADYRRARQGGVAFGAKFAVTREGGLSVGDEIVVDSWGDTEL